MDFELVGMQTFKLENLLEQTSSEDVHGQWIESDGGMPERPIPMPRCMEEAPLDRLSHPNDREAGRRSVRSGGCALRVTNESDFRDRE